MSEDGARLRILIPVLGFGRAGGNRVLSQLANMWCADGHYVAFASPDTSELPYFATRAEIFWLNKYGGVARQPHTQGATGIGNFRSLLGGMRTLHHTFDIVLANHSLTTWPVLLAGVPRSKRFYYIQAYEPDYYAEAGKPLNRIASSLSYRFPFTQIVNATTYRGLEDRPFVPFGIDTSLFHPVEHRAQSHGPLVLGTIGRTEPGKGTRFVLDAFRQVRVRMPEARLRVAYGNLPEGCDLSGIDIVTPRSDAELASFYRSVDILVTGAYGQEGAPHYPVLEAMACGIPVVNTGYLPATQENSWIARARDASSLAEQITQIISDPAVTESKRGAALAAIQSFEWQAIAQRMMTVFRQCS